MQSVNLMPPEWRRRRFILDRARIWGTVAAMTLAATAGSGGTLQYYLNRQTQRLRAVQTQGNDPARLQADAQELRDSQQRYDLAQNILLDVARPTGWDRVIAAVADATDDAVWLNTLRISRESATPNKGDQTVQPRGRFTAEISGYALTNADFTAFLSRLKSAESVIRAEPLHARQGILQGADMIDFSIRCFVATSPHAPSSRSMTHAIQHADPSFALAHTIRRSRRP